MSSLYPTALFEAAHLQDVDAFSAAADLPLVVADQKYLLDCVGGNQEYLAVASESEVSWTTGVGTPNFTIVMSIMGIHLEGFRIPNLSQGSAGYTDIETQPFNTVYMRGGFDVSELVIASITRNSETRYPFAAINNTDAHHRLAMDALLHLVIPKLPRVPAGVRS